MWYYFDGRCYNIEQYFVGMYLTQYSPAHSNNRVMTQNDQIRETTIFCGNFVEMTIFFGNFVRVF